MKKLYYIFGLSLIMICGCTKSKDKEELKKAHLHTLFLYHLSHPEIKDKRDLNNFIDYTNHSFYDSKYGYQNEYDLSLDSVKRILTIRPRNFLKRPKVEINLKTEVVYNDWCTNTVANQGLISNDFSNDPRQESFFKKVHDTLMHKYKNTAGIPIYNWIDTVRVDINHRLMFKYQYDKVDLHLNCSNYKNSQKIEEIKKILTRLVHQKQEFPFDYALIPVGMEY